MNFDAVHVLAVAAAVSITGAAMVVASLVSASRRGQPLGVRFWVPRSLLLGKELVLNRGGFALAVAGIVMMLLALNSLTP